MQADIVIGWLIMEAGIAGGGTGLGGFERMLLKM